MAYARAGLNLVLDNAHRWGYPQRLGLGRDWVAAEPRPGEGTPRRSASLRGAVRWDLGNGACEYIEAIGGIAPVGLSEPTGWGTGEDSFDARVTVTPEDKWWPTPACGRFGGVRWLMYRDERPGRLAAGDYGRAQFDVEWRDVRLWIYRHPIWSGETGPSGLSLTWLGPEGYTGPRYAIMLPRARAATMQTPLTETERHVDGPTLFGLGVGCEHYTVIDEYSRVSCGIRDDNGAVQSTFDMLSVEFLDGWMIARWMSREEAWTYRGRWRDEKGREVEFALPRGRMQINVWGEGIDCTLSEIVYPREVTIRPTSWLVTPGGRWQLTPWYRRVLGMNMDEDWIEHVGKVDGGDNRAHYLVDVTVATELDNDNPSRTRPAVTFHGPAIDGDEGMSRARAVLYRVQEFRHPELTGASSSPIQSQGNTALRVASANGRCSRRWRDASMTVEVYAEEGETLPAIGPNQWIRAEVTCDDGASHHVQFAGRVIPPAKSREGAELTRATLEAVGDDVRLRDHKRMYAHPSYEWWPIPAAFRYLLSRGNVPAARVWIDPRISMASMGDDFFLPRAHAGEGRLGFDDETDLAAAIDACMETRDLQWGWDHVRDRYFLRPRPQRYDGRVDLAIDESTMDADAGDVIYSLRHLHSIEDYANMIAVLAEREIDAAAAIMLRWASIADPTDPLFLADDWQHIEHYEDADAVRTMAERLWQERGRLGGLAIAVLHDLPQIEPDWCLQLTVDDVGIGAGSVWRVDEKAWEMEQEDGWYQQTLELVLEVDA